MNIRLSKYHVDLLNKLAEITDSDKSKCVRSAIEYYAHYLLDDDIINNLRMYHLFGDVVKK